MRLNAVKILFLTIALTAMAVNAANSSNGSGSEELTFGSEDSGTETAGHGAGSASLNSKKATHLEHSKTQVDLFTKQAAEAVQLAITKAKQAERATEGVKALRAKAAEAVEIAAQKVFTAANDAVDNVKKTFPEEEAATEVVRINTVVGQVTAAKDAAEKALAAHGEALEHSALAIDCAVKARESDKHDEILAQAFKFDDEMGKAKQSIETAKRLAGKAIENIKAFKDDAVNDIKAKQMVDDTVAVLNAAFNASEEAFDLNMQAASTAEKALVAKTQLSEAINYLKFLNSLAKPEENTQDNPQKTAQEDTEETTQEDTQDNPKQQTSEEDPTVESLEADAAVEDLVEQVSELSEEQLQKILSEPQSIEGQTPEAAALIEAVEKVVTERQASAVAFAANSVTADSR